MLLCVNSDGIQPSVMRSLGLRPHGMAPILVGARWLRNILKHAAWPETPMLFLDNLAGGDTC